MRAPRRNLFLALLLLAAPLAAARHWMPLGPFGGSISQIAVDPSDERGVYALSEGGVLFKSVDGGGDWVPLHGFGAGSVGSIAVDPARHGTVYVVAGQKLLKSVDGGASWSAVGPRSDPSISSVVVDPAQASRVYAGGASGIWVSTNRGASWKLAWSPTATNESVRRLTAVRQPAGTVFAVTSAGTYKSVDAGATWRALTLSTAPLQVGLFAAAPSDGRRLYAVFADGKLWRSTDGGGTWRLAGRQPAAGDGLLSLAVSSRSPRTLWLLTRWNGLFRSMDAGDTWTASAPVTAGHIAAVALAPSSPGTVYAGLVPEGLDAGGVFASTDGGTTWTRRNHGLFGLDLTAMALDPSNPRILWAGHQGGLYRSANAGARWARMVLPSAPSAWGFSFGGIVLDPAAPSTVYALAGGLWRSLDGGASWTEVFAPESSHPPLRLLRMTPEEPAKLWGIGGGWLYESADAGAHWDLVKPPQPKCGLSDLAFAPSSPSTLYTGGSHGYPDEICLDWSLPAFFRSTDGGATWTDLSAGLRGNFDTTRRIAVDPVDPRRVYIGTTAESLRGYRVCQGVWKSADGGTTWAQAGRNIGCVTAVAASPVAGVLWAGTGDGRIFRSGDAGATWRDRTGGLLAQWINDLILDPVDPSRIYAATSTGMWVWQEDARPGT